MIEKEKKIILQWKQLVMKSKDTKDTVIVK